MENIGLLNALATSVPHYIETNQQICKSVDWFVHDGEHQSLMG